MVAPKRPIKSRSRITSEEIQAVRSCVLEHRDSKLKTLKLLHRVARITKIRSNRVITIVYTHLVPKDTYFNAVWEGRRTGTSVPIQRDNAVTGIDGYLEQVMESFSNLVAENVTLRSQLDQVEFELKEQGEWVATLEKDNLDLNVKVMELDKLLAEGPATTKVVERFKTWAEVKFGKTLTQ